MSLSVRGQAVKLNVFQFTNDCYLRSPRQWFPVSKTFKFEAIYRVGWSISSIEFHFRSINRYGGDGKFIYEIFHVVKKGF